MNKKTKTYLISIVSLIVVVGLIGTIVYVSMPKTGDTSNLLNLSI